MTSSGGPVVPVVAESGSPVGPPGTGGSGAGGSGAGGSGAGGSGVGGSGAVGSGAGAAAAGISGGMSDVELAGRLRVAVGLLVRRLRQRDPGHLSPAQLSALVAIEAGGPVRNGDLAARENVAAPTMTRMVGAMEEAGLVSRGPDPSDARGSLVSLAPGGAAALRALRRERNNILIQKLAGLTLEQRAALEAALPALEALLDE
jgi:DNA-binding MarR family transcriptional regulator